MKRKIFGLIFIFLLVIFPSKSFASDYPNNSETIKNRILNEAKVVSEEILQGIDEEEVSYKINDKARRIPVLMFHEVGYGNTKEYSDANFILKEGLESKLMYLSSNGYKTITMNDLYNNWTRGTELPEKPVILTFDDGYASHFTFVKDSFKRFNAVGTFYIIQDRLFMDIKDRNVEGLKSLHKAGMEIGVHSYSHPDFWTISYDEIYKEIGTSKKFLEDTLGMKVLTFSYPYGNFNQNAIDILKEMGFRTAVTTKNGVGDPYQFNEDAQLKISRYNVDVNTSDEAFIKMLNGTY